MGDECENQLIVSALALEIIFMGRAAASFTLSAFSLLYSTFMIVMNAYALIIIEQHSRKVKIDAKFVHVCGRVCER